MGFNQLTDEEKLIYMWKKDCLGGFRAALLTAISRADPGNRTRLRMGFPLEVDAYNKFTTEDSFWEGIESKMTREVLDD